jgi:hypothetical protein
MKKPPQRPQLEQKCPEEIVNGLLGIIRRQFVPNCSDKEWYKDHNRFIRRNVVLWPARFMVGKKGFTLPPDRYEAIMLAILNDVKVHGQTGQVRYWPGYLMHCVQQHWEHHWEEYYQEAKSLRTQAEAALLALEARRGDPESNAVEVMAATHRLLAGKKKVRKSKPATQGELAL